MDSHLIFEYPIEGKEQISATQMCQDLCIIDDTCNYFKYDHATASCSIYGK